MSKVCLITETTSRVSLCWAGILAKFEKAAAIDPGQGGFRLNISLVYHLQGDHQRAEAIYAQLIAEDSAYDGLLDFVADVGAADEHYQLAVSYMQQEEFDRAIDRLDQALRADPEMGHAYNTKAVALAHKGEFDRAYAMLEKAAELLADHTGVQLNMAVVRYQQGRADEAAALYRQVLEQDSRYRGYLEFLE